jgi:hypothetical protein
VTELLRQKAALLITRVSLWLDGGKSLVYDALVGLDDSGRLGIEGMILPWERLPFYFAMSLARK